MVLLLYEYHFNTGPEVFSVTGIILGLKEVITVHTDAFKGLYLTFHCLQRKKEFCKKRREIVRANSIVLF